MARYKIVIEYDGSSFVGWQRQQNGTGVQESIETAIKELNNILLPDYMLQNRLDLSMQQSKHL